MNAQHPAGEEIQAGEHVGLDTDGKLKEIDNSRRLKILRADRQLLVECFAALRQFRYLNLPKIQSVPADAEVVDIREDWDSRSLSILLRHPSFERVPDGACIPYIENEYVTAFENIPLEKSLLVVRHAPGAPDSFRESVAEISKTVGQHIVLMPHGYEIESLDDEKLAEIGLQRVDQPSGATYGKSPVTLFAELRAENESLRKEFRLFALAVCEMHGGLVAIDDRTMHAISPTDTLMVHADEANRRVVYSRSEQTTRGFPPTSPELRRMQVDQARESVGLPPIEWPDAPLPYDAAQFERDYATASGLTIEQNRELGLRVEPCDCGEGGCKGFKMAHSPPDAGIALVNAMSHATRRIARRLVAEREQAAQEAILKSDGGTTAVPPIDSPWDTSRNIRSAVERAEARLVRQQVSLTAEQAAAAYKGDTRPIPGRIGTLGIIKTDTPGEPVVTRPFNDRSIPDPGIVPWAEQPMLKAAPWAEEMLADAFKSGEASPASPCEPLAARSTEHSIETSVGAAGEVRLPCPSRAGLLGSERATSANPRGMRFESADTLADNPCPECKGSGIYQGFSVEEKCKNCGGTGAVC